MNDAGQFGAFLPNLSGPQASGRSIPRREDGPSGDRGDAGGFGDVFDASRGPRGNDQREDADAAGRASSSERGEIIENDQERLIADPPATQHARDASADDLLGFNLPFPGDAQLQRGSYFQSIQGRINDGVYSDLVKLPGNAFPGGLAALQAGEQDFRLNADASLSTVKVTQAPIYRSGAPLNGVTLGAASGEAGRAGAALSALTPIVAGSVEAPLNVDRFSELRPNLVDANASGLRLSSQTASPQIAAGTSDVYSILAGSFNGASVGPSAAGEIDILADLALATSSAAARASVGPAQFAPANTPSFTGAAGVLPQIQAAIIAGNGRDMIEVRLDPPDLGRVRIDFSVEGGDAIKAIIGADRSETLDHLRRNIADLEQQLKQAGFGSISFEFRKGGEHHHASDRDDLQSTGPGDVGNNGGDLPTKIYLTMRENAQLDLLL